MTLVYCTFRQAGFHHWPKAPNWCAYLREPHRHEFHVRVEVAVTDYDRELEFITIKRVAEEAFRLLRIDDLYGGHPDFGAQSCEMLAVGLRGKLITAYPAIYAVEVSEDGENGARVQ